MHIMDRKVEAQSKFVTLCFAFKSFMPTTLAYIFLFARDVVSWRSGMQTIIASSTMEGKFIGCYKSTS